MMVIITDEKNKLILMLSVLFVYAKWNVTHDVKLRSGKGLDWGRP